MLRRIAGLREKADKVVRLSLADCWRTMPYMKAQMVTVQLMYNGYHTETQTDGTKVFYEFDGNTDCTTARAQADAMQVALVEKYNFPKLDI